MLQISRYAEGPPEGKIAVTLIRLVGMLFLVVAACDRLQSDRNGGRSGAQHSVV